MVRNVKTRSLLCILIIVGLSMIASPLIKGQDRPSIFVSPADNTFYTNTTSTGFTFNVSIMSADWVAPGVFGYEFKLTYDNTMLEAVAAEIPTNHWLKPTVKPTNFFPVDSGTIDQTAGTVSFAAALLAPEEGKIGGGTIAVVTLKIIAAAPSSGSLTSTIGLKDVIMVDPSATPIPQANYDIVNAKFKFAAPPPLPGAKPMIFVDPAENKFSNQTKPVGSSFTVSIRAVKWTSPGVFGYEFKLRYDAAMVQAVSAELPTGHWLTPQTPGSISIIDSGTINQGQGFVSFNATLTGSEPGKTGNGTIATITFNIIQAPPPNGVLASSLEISDLNLIDPSKTPISADTFDIFSGEYSLSAGLLGDLNSDGKVNIQDIAIWATAFGSSPSHSRWNPVADVNNDGKVNMIDGVLMVMHFSD